MRGNVDDESRDYVYDNERAALTGGAAKGGWVGRREPKEVACMRAA